MAGIAGRTRSTDIYIERNGDRYKICSRCRIEKSLDEYNKDTSQKWGIRVYCKGCSIAVKQERNKTRSKKNHLWAKYRLRPEDYYSKLEEQGFCCAICDEPEDFKALVVDHDHDCCPQKTTTCGECVRALICSDCNLGLGRFFDRPELLQQAADYIRYWRDKRGE